jgi:hypothetical protein
VEFYLSQNVLLKKCNSEETEVVLGRRMVVIEDELAYWNYGSTPGMKKYTCWMWPTKNLA